MRTPRARSDELSTPTKLQALRAEREHAVTRWRSYVGGETLHRPEPLLAEREGAFPGRWLAEDAIVPDDAIRCGLDRHDNVVVARGSERSGFGEQFLTRNGTVEELVLIERDSAGETSTAVTHVLRDANGRVERTTDQDETVEHYRYDHRSGRLLEVQTSFADEPTASYSTRCIYDEAGSLASITRHTSTKSWTVWTASQDTFEDDVPSFREAFAAVPRGLAQATAAAMRAALSEIAEPRFAVVCATDRSFPWEGVIVSARYLADIAAAGAGTDAAIDLALVARTNADPGVCGLPIVEHADPETQQRIRQIRQRMGQARALPVEQRRQQRTERDGLQQQVYEEALRLLNGRDGLAPHTVVLWTPTRALPAVERDLHQWKPTIETAGMGAVKAIWAELDRGTSRLPELPKVLPATRAGLWSLASRVGLERVADALAADARLAVALQPTRSGASSQLGGVPALPSGMRWPTRGGRALTPLASIDCSTLPAEIDDRDVLPSDGTLAIFADLGDLATLCATPTQHSDRVRIIHVPARTSTHEPPMPAELNTGVLPVVPVELVACTTLRERWASQAKLGLTTGEALIYDRLLGVEAESSHAPHAQLLGHDNYAADDEQGQHQRLLLAVQTGEWQGLSHIADATIRICLPAGAFRDQRWDAATLGAITGDW